MMCACATNLRDDAPEDCGPGPQGLRDWPVAGHASCSCGSRDHWSGRFGGCLRRHLAGHHDPCLSRHQIVDHPAVSNGLCSLHARPRGAALARSRHQRAVRQIEAHASAARRRSAPAPNRAKSLPAAVPDQQPVIADSGSGDDGRDVQIRSLRARRWRRELARPRRGIRRRTTQHAWLPSQYARYQPELTASKNGDGELPALDGQYRTRLERLSIVVGTQPDRPSQPRNAMRRARGVRPAIASSGGHARHL